MKKHGHYAYKSLFMMVATTFAQIALWVVIFSLIYYNYNQTILYKTSMSRHISTLVSQTKYLEEENYDEIDTKNVLSKGDFFEIVDERGKVLYSSADSSVDAYSEEYLSFVPNTDGKFWYLLQTVLNEGKEEYVIVKVNSETFEFSELTVLNENLDIVYSDLPEQFNHISKSTFKLLVENENSYIQKYRFETNSGANRYMLIHLKGNYKRDLKDRRIRRNVSLVVYVTLLLITIFTGGYRLAKKIIKPIKQVEKGLRLFTQGGRNRLLPIDKPSEIARVVETFNEMNTTIVNAENRNKKLEEDKRRLLADISHDLKTPITVIQGYANALKDGLIPPEEQAKYFKIIAQKTTLLSNLINEVSEYSKLDHPEVKLKLKPMNITEQVRTYFADRYDELAMMGHEILAEITDEKMIAEVDGFQLTRVFDNLISNFLKYTQNDTDFLIVMQKEKTHAKMYIGDNGKGIDTKMKETLFEPFTVGDEARSSGKGTGLGLAIAKKIIEEHHGTIKVATKQEVEEMCKILKIDIVTGLIFCIEIPLL